MTRALGNCAATAAAKQGDSVHDSFRKLKRNFCDVCHWAGVPCTVGVKLDGSLNSIAHQRQTCLTP